MAEEESQTTDVETAPAAPEEVVSPKERRTRTRARKAAKTPAAKVLTPEERQAERVAVRAAKAAERRRGRLRAREKAKARRTGAVATPAREHVQGKQKSRLGVVISDRAAKTITVRVDVAHRHRRYEKV